jgi:hypothetical protein
VAGRPRAYETPEELAEQVDAYFADRDAQDKPPTMAGLSYFLGFSDRSSFTEYEDREGFSHTVKSARLRIELDRSEKLIGKDTFTPGLIFDLKNNHGWKDKNETELTGKDGAPLTDGIDAAARIAALLEEARVRRNADG